MPHHLAIYIMIHRCIVFRIVRKAGHLRPDCPYVLHGFLFVYERFHRFLYVFYTLRCEKDRRFIHIVPKSLYAGIRQALIFLSKPFSGIRI